MLRLEFDSTLETGDVTVDDQHRTLIGMFNDLAEASASGSTDDVVRETLEKLARYTREHFAEEQRLMIEAKYPPEDVMAHVDEHLKLADETGKLVSDHARSGTTTILPLAMFLRDWLATHIRVYDQKLVNHVRARA